jgi:hypothetical protein
MPIVASPANQPKPQATAAAAGSPSHRDVFAERRQNIIDLATNRAQPADTVEEPLWKAIRNGTDYVRRRWHGDGVPQMPILHKAALSLAIILTIIWFANDVFGLALQAFIVYAIYYVIWSSFIKPGLRRQASNTFSPASAGPVAGLNRRKQQQTAAWPTDSAAQAAARGVTASPTRRRPVRPGWRERAHQQLAAKTMRERISELLGSMLIAAAFAAVAACIAPLSLGEQQTSTSLAMYLWLATIGTLGSWAILVPAKLVEGKLEDQVPMRLTMLLCGALVGFAGWLLAGTLLLTGSAWRELPADGAVDLQRGVLSNEVLGWPATANEMNIGPAYYIAYFAFLFLLPRWWRQTEMTRDGRLSLWWVAVCVGWAWLLHIFWWFPQPAGMMVAGVISLATQLSSPWMPPSRRRTLAAEIDGGAV